MQVYHTVIHYSLRWSESENVSIWRSAVVAVVAGKLNAIEQQQQQQQQSVAAEDQRRAAATAAAAVATGQTFTIENGELSKIDEHRDDSVDALDKKGKKSLVEVTKLSQQQQQPTQLQQSPSLSSGSFGLCRICHTDSWPKEPLISPCRCKGSLAYVHLSCLERWLNQSSRNYCELCNFRYNAHQTQRYTWFESLRIWINHPRNRLNIKADLLIFSLLTVFTAGLSSVCLLGSRYFVLEGARIGFSEGYTRSAVILFILIICMGYGVSVYLMIKNQVTPWYHWWRHAVNIQLILDTLPPTTTEEQESAQQQNQRQQPNDVENAAINL
uniref:RING-CH-type domain-containing protein n=1 Tax=Trichogramma kaykai TaxID=54128 RepID=A0ABD2WPE8_9HYME